MSGDLPDEVGTDRLRLPLWDAATVAALRSGGRREDWHPQFPREEEVAAAELWRDGDPWGPRSVVSRRSGLVTGSIGCFGPPAPAADGVPEVEVGFGLVAAVRGHGAMREALAALVPLLDGADVRVRARVRPDNRPAMRLLAGQGFSTIRATDPDGHLVLVRPRP